MQRGEWPLLRYSVIGVNSRDRPQNSRAVLRYVSAIPAVVDATRCAGTDGLVTGSAELEPRPHDLVWDSSECGGSQKNQAAASEVLDGLEIDSGSLTALILLQLVRYSLVLLQRGQARAFHSADMHERILTTTLGCDKTETLVGIEEFNGAGGHLEVPCLYERRQAQTALTGRKLD
jgi:hypothetical protein